MADQYRRPYYESDNSPNRNRCQKGNDGFYWFIMAVLLLSGAWPISLIMLLVKLGSDKAIDRTYDRMAQRSRTTAPQQTAAAPAYRSKKQPRRAKDTVLHQPKKGAKALIIIGAIVALVGLLLALEPLTQIISWGYYGYLLEEMLHGLGIALCGGCMYTAGRGMKKRDRRYQHYLSAIQGQSVVMIKTLASIAGVSARRVYKDLDEMLEDGLLPKGAFVDRTRQCLVLDATAMDYAQEAAEVTHPKETAPAAPQETEAADMPANEYALILQQIRQVNDDIEDEAMSAKIDHIETITRSIFAIIEEKPDRKQEIRNFFNYYLPTTQKLLNFYAQLEEQPVQSQTILDSRKNIEGIMDNLVKGFEAQLDSLFKADALDISTDISVLENMLAQDGLRPSTAENAMAEAARRTGTPAASAAPAAPAPPKSAAAAAATMEMPQ